MGTRPYRTELVGYQHQELMALKICEEAKRSFASLRMGHCWHLQSSLVALDLRRMDLNCLKPLDMALMAVSGLGFGVILQNTL